jgi:hypothetical protein
MAWADLPTHYFQRPITQKVLKCKIATKITYSTENLCRINVLGYVPLKNIVLCLFYAPEQANA